MDLPRSFTIRDSSHRLCNPFTSEKLAILGQAISPSPGTRVLDLACGKGELLCTWARDHGVFGTGVDISTVFLDAARTRAAELGVADRVGFVHADASGHIAEDPVDIAACVGATWIGSGVAGTVELLRRSLVPRRHDADRRTVLAPRARGPGHRRGLPHGPQGRPAPAAGTARTVRDPGL